MPDQSQCPADDVFVAFIAGELDDDERVRVELHVDRCEACGELLAQLARSPLVELPSDAASDAALMLPRRLVRGEVVGRYVVVRELGSGGMGVVYVARDPELDRLVALKLMRPRLAEGAQARLLAEARTLAAISHRNVVQVFDVGTHADQVFVAMELVEATDLRQWRAQTKPTWREALAVCIDAGRGLAAVHAVGIVHRDVKPSNVLVAADGRVVLIDFGLAGERSRPSSRDIVGTPGYIAPELLEGAPAGPHGDQFAYCVLVHETVYGVRPFDEKGRPIVVDRSHAPARLNAAIQRGLAQRPADRFDSIEALLHELAAIASPSRIGRFVLAGAAMLGVATIAFATLGMREQGRCEAAGPRVAQTWSDRKPEVERAFAATGLSFAAPTFSRVAAALDAWTQTWADEYAAACEQAGPELDARMACLERDRRRVTALVDVLAAADRDTVVQASSIETVLPDSTICRSNATPSDPRSEPIYDRIAAAEAELAAGRYASASRIAEEAHREASGSGDPALLLSADLTLGRTAGKDAALGLAEARLQAAVAGAEALGDDATAVRALLELVWLEGYTRLDLEAGRHHARHAEALLARLSDAEELHAHLEYRKGWIELAAADAEAAEPHFRAALEGHTDAFDKAADHSAIGAALLQLGDQERAGAELQRARTLGEQALGPHHPDLVPLLNNLGALQRNAGALEEAEATYRRLIAIAVEAYGEAHVLVGRLRLNLGTVLLDRGHLDAATREFETAGEILEAALGREHPDVARALDGRAQAEHNDGDLEAAIRLYERALAIRQAALGDDHPSLALSLTNIGLLRVQAGRPEEALAPLRRGVELIESAYGENEQLVTALGALGDALVEAGRGDEAASIYDRAIAIGERVDAADVGTMMQSRADLHLEAGRAREAEALLRRALERWAEQTGEDPVHEGYARFSLARTLEALGRHDEAQAEARRALQQVAVGDPKHHAEIRRWLEQRAR